MFRKKQKPEEKNSASMNPLASLLQDMPLFELHGNREVQIEGCKGVLEYDSCIIRINTGTMVVSFTGRNLNLKCLSPSSLIIDGFITNIEFVM